MGQRSSVTHHARVPLPWPTRLAVTAIAVSPFADGVSALLFAALLLVLGARRCWTRVLATRAKALFAATTVLLIVWFLVRAEQPWGTGLRSFRDPALYPVNVLDSICLLLSVWVVASHSFSATEAKALHAAIAATIPVHFAFGLAERLGWTARWIVGPTDFPLIRLTLNPPFNERVSAGFYNPNGLGFYATCAMVAAAVLLVLELRMRPLRRHPWGRLARSTILALALLLGMLLAAWSGSRWAWLTSAILAVLLLWLTRLRLRHVVYVVAVGAVLALLAVVDVHPLVKVRRVLMTDAPVRGVERTLGVNPLGRRLAVYACAIELARERPLLGWGVGSFAPECERRIGGWPINHAHNAILQLAAEIGIPFTLLMVALVGYVVYVSGRAVLSQTQAEQRIVFGGMYLMGLGGILLSQSALAVAHSMKLSVVFWLSLAVPLSLADTGGDRSGRDPSTPEPSQRR